MTAIKRTFSAGMDITLDLGLETDFDNYGEIIQQTQKVTDYDNLITALNYLNSLGWELVHFKPTHVDGFYHNYEGAFLMKRKY
jgi:hypothetical protein